MRISKRWARKNPEKFISLLLLVIGVLGYSIYMNNHRLAVNPKSYKPLLSLIAKAESNDNYNAYFGNASNTRIDFTSMSISDVMKWQQQHVAAGNPSSAVGKYQIISPTLTGLVEQLGIDATANFDSTTQDKLAIALLERRGSVDFINQDISREEFAANLAKEWASLPKVVGDSPENSYYAGDGLNKSRVNVKSVLKSIDQISAE